MSIKRVAITLRVVEAQAYMERRDAIAHDWHRWLRTIFPNAILLPIPNDPPGVRHWLDVVRPHGVILSNGNDWGKYSVRDDTELEVIQSSLKVGIPLLGVCRGLQVLNIYFGGTLYEGLGRRPETEKHVAWTHAVQLDGSWAGLFAVPTEMDVNSYHDHGVLPAGLADALQVFAATSDGVVEGLYHPEKAALGIQWHPERESPSRDFDSLLITRLFEQGAFWR